jgi:hypothetical protein
MIQVTAQDLYRTQEKGRRRETRNRRKDKALRKDAAFETARTLFLRKPYYTGGREGGVKVGLRTVI